MWQDLEKNIRYLSLEEANLVQKAYQIAIEVFQDNRRNNNQYYIEHKVNVAKILAGIKLDNITIISALLYGDLAEGKLEQEQYKKILPPEVHIIVEDLNKIIKIFQTAGPCTQEKYAENLRRMFLATSRDFRVFFIKLADRIDVLLNLSHIDLKRAKEIAEQAIRIDTEIAARMGITILKNKIEDSAFQYLHPQIWEYMVKNESLNFETRTSLAKNLQGKTIKFLSSVKFPYLEIMGRAKGYYAVYNKLYDKGKTIDQVHDLIALRIIVEDIPKCYQALEEIHKIFPEHVERTKDYIIKPKENGYQSLHTTVIDKATNVSFEFQIRTQEMHEFAEYGAAAHWAYKKKVKVENKLSFLDPTQLMNLGETLRRGAWNLFVRQNEDEQAHNLEVRLFRDKVFVLTPKGDVISLPNHSTVLDFAYKIHQEVGNKAVYARINGMASSLSAVLKTGNTVEIVTDKNQTPKNYWTKWVSTTNASKMIKNYLKEKSENHPK